MLLTNILPLAQDQGIRQASGARRHVYRTSAGEVKGAKLEEPAIGVPSPEGNGAVADCRPSEAENDGGNDSSAFEGSAYNDHDGAGAEHELIEAEDNLWDKDRAPRWCHRHIDHAEL